MTRRSFQPFLITAFLAAFPYVLLSVSDRRAALYDLATTMPYLVSALVAFLSLKLNQRRPFFLAVVLAFVYAAVEPLTTPRLPFSDADRSAIVALSTPLTLLLLFSLPEKFLARGMWSSCLAVVAGPTTFLFLALRFFPEPVRSTLFWRGTAVARQIHLPATAICLALLFFGMTFLTRDRFQRDFRVFAALALLPLMHVLHRIAGSTMPQPALRLESALGFMSCGTVLTYAVFRLYWQKVFVDELTGIPNRRALNDKLARLRGTYAIAMTDIDHFKRFNDRYGHEEGDHVLRFVGKHLDAESNGHAYRYGGEEICIVLDGVDGKTAAELMESARSRLADKRFHIRSPKHVRARTSEKDREKQSTRTEPVRVTVSIGVAGSGKDLGRPEDVLIAADSALYRAKELGRNRVLLAQVSERAETRLSGA